MATVSLKKILTKRLPASSILEVTTAMIIISMVFGLAIIIYLNIQRSGVSSLKLSSRIKLEAVFSETNRLKKFESREVRFEDIIVYQEIEHNSEGLLSIKLEARDEQGKLIAQQKHLIYAP
jgi:hypothetical protein